MHCRRWSSCRLVHRMLNQAGRQQPSSEAQSELQAEQRHPVSEGAVSAVVVEAEHRQDSTKPKLQLAAEGAAASARDSNLQGLGAEQQAQAAAKHARPESDLQQVMLSTACTLGRAHTGLLQPGNRGLQRPETSLKVGKGFPAREAAQQRAFEMACPHAMHLTCEKRSWDGVDTIVAPVNSQHSIDSQARQLCLQGGLAPIFRPWQPISHF